MKNILLTGGAGYIGSHVANYLLDKGCKITIIDNLSIGHKKTDTKKSKFYNCDIANTKKFNKYIKWKPKYNNLRYILKSSYEWEKKNYKLKS